MPSVFIPSRGAQVQPIGSSEAPPPGFLETLGAGFRTTKDDVPLVQEHRLFEAYLPVMTALAEANGGVGKDYRTWTGIAGQFLPYSNIMNQYDLDALWADVAKAQGAGKLQGFSKDRATFEKDVLTRQGARSDDLKTASDGNVIASTIGGIGASFFDPVNLATAPIGGGAKTIGSAILRGAIINMGIEAVQQVPLIEARARMGEELTLKEAAINVGMAAAFGGILEGGTKVIGNNWDGIKTAPKAVQEKVWAKIIETSPALQQRMAGKMDWDAIGDADLPDLAESLIGLDNLSPDEKGAIASMRRDAQIEGMNPYIADGAGIAAHRGELAAAMQRIMDQAPPTIPNARAAPVAPSSGPLPRLRAGTAISSGNVSGDARAVVKSRIGVVESNNKANARPIDKNGKILSSALGKYQFLESTWSTYYIRRFGTGGLTPAQIANKRTDSRLQDILMDDLMDDNAAYLRKNGHAVDAGNLYLAHFAGTGGANKILRADPNASARSVLGNAVVDANKFLDKMNAADVGNWAHRKMTGKGSVSQSGGGVSRETDIDPEADTRDWVARELAAVDAESAALDAEDAGGPSPSAIVDDGLDAQPEPFDISTGDSIDPPRPIEPAARLSDAAPVEVLAVLPQLREVVRSRSIRLDRQKEIAEALGTDIETVRAGLVELAKLREIRVKPGKDGTDRFTQIPRDNRPTDMLRFIARRGGLSPTGLDPRFADVEGMSRGHALGKGGRDWDKHYVHGAGNLVRKNGRGLDEIGEDLWDAGYFGETRPTESELIDAIEEAVQGRGTRYIPGDAPEERSIKASAPWLDEQDMFDMRRDFDAAAQDSGFALDDEAFEAAARMYADGEYENVGDAIVDMINREIEADRAATLYEAGDDYYDAQIEQFIADARAAGFDFDEGIDGPAILTGDAGAQSPTGRNAIGQSADQGPTELAPEAYKPFDDPADGEGVTAQVDSMEHDLRAQVSRETESVSAGSASRPDYSPDDDAIPLENTKTADLWLLSEDELEALEDGLRTAEKENVRRALGDEQFQKYEKMISDNARSNFLDQLELDDRQSLLIYGRQSDPRASADDVAEVRKAIGSIALDDSQSYLVGELIAALGKLDSSKIEAVNAGLGTSLDQAAFITFRNAVVALENQGVKRSDIPTLIGKGYEARGIEAADAEFMMEKLFGAPENRQPQQLVKALPSAPTVEDFKTGFRQLWNEGDDAIHDFRVGALERFDGRMDDVFEAMDQTRQELGATGDEVSAKARQNEIFAEAETKAKQIIDAVNRGAKFQFYTPGTQKLWQISDPSTVRVGPGGLQMVRGQKWETIPAWELDAILQQVGKRDAADMFGGATDVEKRQALERQGEGGLSNDAAQKPVGSDGGLFDPDSWAQAGFRLNEDGDVVNPADLLAEFDAEAAILKTIKDCL